jgi:hypothetical protein
MPSGAVTAKLRSAESESWPGAELHLPLVAKGSRFFNVNHSRRLFRSRPHQAYSQECVLIIKSS